MSKYTPICWPDIQFLFEIPEFYENAILINDEKGLEDFGSSAYFVETEWLSKWDKNPVSEENTYVMIDFPESQMFEEQPGFEEHSYPRDDEPGYFVELKWINNHENY